MESYQQHEDEHYLQTTIDNLLHAEETSGLFVVRNYTNAKEVTKDIYLSFPVTKYLKAHFLTYEILTRFLTNPTCMGAFVEPEELDEEQIEFFNQKRFEFRNKVMEYLDTAQISSRGVPQGGGTIAGENVISKGLGRHILLPDPNTILLQNVTILAAEENAEFGSVFKPTAKKYERKVMEAILWLSGLGRLRNLKLTPGKFDCIELLAKEE